MPHTIKLTRERYNGVRPRSEGDRRAVLKIVAYVVIAVVSVLGLRALQGHWSAVREVTWKRAQGKVEMVRPVLVSQGNGQGGSLLLYQAEVLVSFQSDTGPERRWIRLRQSPRRLADIELEDFRWKGATCVVLWNSADPREIDADVS